MPPIRGGGWGLARDVKCISAVSTTLLRSQGVASENGAGQICVPIVIKVPSPAPSLSLPLPLAQFCNQLLWSGLCVTIYNSG